MLQLMRIFWDICRLKTGPQDLPTGRYILSAAVLAGIIIDSFTTSIFMPKFSVIDLAKLVVTFNIVLLVAIYFLLKLIGYAERAIQTITAIAGSGLFISLVLLPGLLVMNSVDGQVKSFAIFILIDNVWRIAVNAHIFRHALSVGLLMAMIVSVSYLLFGVLVADILLPAQSN
ncbi:MAG: hypothetical protein OEW99_04340 [Gammaproteobacteria bacterium]|nr:hypothetical protein [Gammaproteobacteria bacterium]MDH5660712.1 hypothetical protein [Gammaproteobacteria bacterium]